jgi:hypothetical protein
MATVPERVKPVYRSLITPGVYLTIAFVAYVVLAIVPEWSRALSATHPLKVTLIMIIVLDWSLITVIFMADPRIPRLLLDLWSGFIALLCLVLAALVLNEIFGPFSSSCLTSECNAFRETGALLVVLIPITFLFLAYTWPLWRSSGAEKSVGTSETAGQPLPNPEATEPREVPDSYGMSSMDFRLWGKLASLILMLLALFAFGLKDEHGPLRVDYKELPAIMIVFILAELGVALVGRAQELTGKVSKATTATQEAGTVLSGAAKDLEDVKTETLTSSNVLKEAISELNDFVHTRLWKTVEDKAARMKLAPSQVYNCLDVFTESWFPEEKRVAASGSSLLLGRLFAAFSGTAADSIDEKPKSLRESGAVRPHEKENVICCVAPDDVFVDVAARWLDAIQEYVTRTPDGRDVSAKRALKVWAVTTLLPTEFAFPSAYHERSAGKANRTKPMERFINSVIQTCKISDVSTEYRRITILAKSENDYLADTEEERRKGITLDNWLVWDSRDTQRARSSEYHNVLEIAQNAGLNVETHSRKIACEDLIDIFHQRSWRADTAKRLQLFPFVSPLPSPKAYAYFDDEESQLVVLAANDANWALRVRSSASDEDLKSVLSRRGWKTVRDWYVSNMHRRGPDGLPASWWVSVTDKDDPFFNPLMLNWSGTDVITHDLLMLGTQADGEETEWHGAAISNISSDRTECTIQLIMDKERLSDISGMLVELSGNFGRRAISAEVKRLVAGFGSWDEWPTEWHSHSSTQATATEMNKGT